MENEILLETEELLQRLVEAVEKLNSAPSEDTLNVLCLICCCLAV